MSNFREFLNEQLRAPAFKKEYDALEAEFSIEAPNAETIAAMNEYFEMKAHPEKYKKYNSVDGMIDDIIGDSAK